MIDGFAYTDMHEHQDRILSILRLLRPHEQVGAHKIRVGRDNDGGYIMVDDFDGVTAAYSLGINDDVSWDKQMAARNIDILQFDHTIDALPENDPRFHWSRTGICGVGEERDGFRSLPEIIRANGHAERDLVLKMDIEGAEWSVFATMPLDLMARFRQIVCEFHGFQHIDQPDFYERAAAASRNLAADAPGRARSCQQQHGLCDCWRRTDPGLPGDHARAGRRLQPQALRGDLPDADRPAVLAWPRRLQPRTFRVLVQTRGRW